MGHSHGNKVWVSLAILSLIGGCSGDGGGRVDEENPPTAAVLFPPPMSLTDAPDILVRGTAHDDSGVVSVQVNGVVASSSDGFATWQARVPLVEGDNQLIVRSVDRADNVSEQATATVVASAEAKLFQPEALAVDAAGNSAVVVDSVSNTVFSVDLTTGAWSVVSEPPADRSTYLTRLQQVVLDEDNGRALVFDTDQNALIEVDLQSGARRVISHATRGSGPDFGIVTQIAFDPDIHRVWLKNPSALLAVDLDSGDRTSVYSVYAGDQLFSDAFGHVGPIALDTAHNRMLVLGDGPYDVSAIDLTSGVRTSIFPDPVVTPDPLLLSSAAGAALDTAHNRLVVLDPAHEAVVAVDLATNERTVLSDATTGSGPMIGSTWRMAFDATNDRVLVLKYTPDSTFNYTLDGLLEVDLTTGNRSLLAAPTFASGPALRDPVDLALDATQDRLLVLGGSSHALFSVDLASGERTTVFEPTVGLWEFSSTAYGIWGGLVLVDTENDRALVADTNPLGRGALFSVSLATGDRSIVAGDTMGSGPALGPSAGLAFEPVTDHVLWARSQDAVYSIDLATGDRTPMSGLGAGAGPPLLSIAGLAVDAPRGRLLMVSADSNALLAVDLTSGDRTVISDHTIGRGPEWLAPRGLLLDGDATRGLVFDYVYEAVFSVDLENGDRTIVQELNPTGDPAVAVPQSGAYDPATGRLFMTDFYVPAVFAMDIETGERVIVAK